MTTTTPVRATVALLALALVPLTGAGASDAAQSGRGGRGGNQSLPPAPLVATGLIVGRVIDPATGRGVPGATVMISGGVRPAPAPPQPGGARPAPPPPPPRYLTDSEGRFAFRNLTRGSYVVSATKPGYADGAHGRLRPNGPTRPIVIGDGERVGEVLIRLFKFGAIGGTVVDDAGEPVVGVSIRAYRRVLVAGRRRFTPFGGNAVTDDRGMYRLSNLTPGDYVVSVPMVSTTMPNGFTPSPRSSPNFESTMYLPNSTGLSFGSGRQVTPDGRFLLQTGAPSSTSAGAIAEADGRLLTSPTMFHPSARSIADAEVLRIGTGEERAGVDIVLPLVAASNISGQLVSPEGDAGGYALHLVAADADALAVEQPVATAVTAPDGSFMFLAVPPGQYVLQTTRVPRPGPPPPPPPPAPVEAPSGLRGSFVAVPMTPAAPSGPTLWASMPITLGDVDLGGLVVMLQEGLTVSGRIEFDGTAPRPAPARLAQIPIIIEPADGRPRAGGTPTRPAADGRFTTGGVVRGKYFLRIGGAPPGWFFRSAMYRGIDLADVPVMLDDSISGVTVTFTDRRTELRGTVSVPSGQPTDAAAVIFPADTEAWKEFGTNSRRLRLARPTSAGTFMFGSPPPGDYFAIAIPEQYATEWQDPAFLEQLARLATRFTLIEAEKKTIDVPFHDVRPPDAGRDPTARVRPGPTSGALESAPANSVVAAPDAERTEHGPYVDDEPAPAPQVRDRSTEPARLGKASISGVIVEAGTGSPVRRARVSVTSPEVRVTRTAITDDAGGFAIPSLPAGRYTLSVAKPAYLTSYHGSRTPGRGPGTPIELTAGQQLTDIRLVLQRGGVVSGIVIDAYGQPLPNLRVRLMRYVMRNGERTLQAASNSGPGMTDDRGVYRLYGVAPGRYVVSVSAPANSTIETRQLSTDEINAAYAALLQSASPTVTDLGTQTNATTRPMAPAPPGSSIEPPRDGRPLGYAAFFYPGTPMEHEAVLVDVAAGQELGGIDIPLRLVPTARVEGTLRTPDGRPPGRVTMSLLSSFAGTTTTRSVRVQADGRFQALAVPPGHYTLTARMIEQPPAPPGPPVEGVFRAPVRIDGPDDPRATYWAIQAVDVNGEDITGVSMTLMETMTLSGRVAFDAHSESAPATGAVRVSLEPIAAVRVGASPRPSPVDESGAFTIAGIVPGSYRLNANLSSGAAGTGGPRWMIKSVVVNGLETADRPFDIAVGEQITDALITFTDRLSELSGTILDASGAPVPGLTVVVFPTDRAWWTLISRRFRPPLRSTDGTFRFAALPPGEYYLAVATDLDQSEWGDSAFMEQLAAAAITLTIGEGEKKVQDLRIGGSPAR